MRLLLICLLLSGCYTGGLHNTGWRTEQYNNAHVVQVKVHPTTSNEWQAKANDECVELLVKAHKKDNTLYWLQSKDETSCTFSFHDNECVCVGKSTRDANTPVWAQFSTLSKVTTYVALNECR